MSANGNVAVAGLLQLTTVVRRHEGTCSNKYHTELRERLQFLNNCFFSLYVYIRVSCITLHLLRRKMVAFEDKCKLNDNRKKYKVSWEI